MSIIREKGYRSVAFTGMAKNVGKTVALNHLLHDCSMHNCRVGLVSIGRDGERRDAWSGAEKPRIWAPENTLIAAAQQSIDNCEASLEIIDNTGIETALGAVCLARVRRPGYVEVATTPSVQKLKLIIGAIQELGAGLVLVDGAIDRAGAAAPAISDCALLSTGASLHHRLDLLVRKTAARAQQLLIPAVNEKKRELAPDLLDRIRRHRSSLVIDAEEKCLAVDYSTLIELEQAVKGYLKERAVKAVYIDGAVLDGLLKLFISCAGKLAGTLLLVRQGTNILVEDAVWNNFLRVHGYIRVVDPIRLLGITASPVSPRGELFCPGDLVDGLAAGLKGLNLPVVDLVAGIYRHSG